MLQEQACTAHTGVSYYTTVGAQRIMNRHSHDLKTGEGEVLHRNQLISKRSGVMYSICKSPNLKH